MTTYLNTHLCVHLAYAQAKVIIESAEHYIGLADMFKREELPYGTQWREVESYREKQVASKEYQWLNFREQK